MLICFITLKRSACRVELAKPLLGVHAALNRSVVLFPDVVQVLHRSVPTTAAQGPFLLKVRDGGAIDRRLIGIDHTRLRMRGNTQGLAKEPFGSLGVARRRQQKINGGAARIDGPIQIALAPLYANVSLVDAPGLVGRLERPRSRCCSSWP